MTINVQEGPIRGHPLVWCVLKFRVIAFLLDTNYHLGTYFKLGKAKLLS